MKRSETILEIQNVSKSFGGLKAVSSVSFHIKEREVVGLIGPNGAGKTTLFNLISGFLKPDTGYVFFQGQDITALKPHTVCRLGIGRTFQIVRPLSSLTVLENIVTAALLHHPHSEEAQEHAIRVAQEVGLTSMIDKRAGGVPVAVKKRLGFAQALATGAKLLLLDEVVAGLNPKEVDDFLHIIRKIASEGRTILMVEHVMRAVMNAARRILVLDRGELIAKGTPKKVTENEKVVNAYLGEKYNF